MATFKNIIPNFLIIAILLFASIGVASSNLDGWQYQKYITVKENSGNT